jgi:hypothetical protein
MPGPVGFFHPAVMAASRPSGPLLRRQMDGWIGSRAREYDVSVRRGAPGRVVRFAASPQSVNRVDFIREIT